MDEVEPHKELMTAAIAHEARAHRAALDGDAQTSRAAFREAAATYRASWECATPKSFGRLVGMQKAAILAGDGVEEAEYVERALAGKEATSPTAAYAQAIAALRLGHDAKAAEWAALMMDASPEFARAATGITALAVGDASAYRAAIAEIVDDFSVREAHLTGVPIADTALMLEALAAPRGLRLGIEGPLMPDLEASA
jgi:hypothetical protein